MLPDKVNHIKEMMYRLLSGPASSSGAESNLPDIVLDQRLQVPANSKNFIMQIQNANIKFINEVVVEVFKVLDEVERDSIELIDAKADYEGAILDLVNIAYLQNKSAHKVLDDVKKCMVDVTINRLPTSKAAAKKLEVSEGTMCDWVNHYGLRKS